MNSVQENNFVKTEMLTLHEISQCNMGFVIPSYQRPYVWNNEDVVKLFDDIKEAFIGSEKQYFIGSALTSLRRDGNYELIDGQQRITTLMLISIAFKSAGVDHPLAKVAIWGEQPRLTFEIRDSVRNLLGSFAGLEKMTKPGPEAIKNDDYLTHLAANLEVLLQLVTTLVKNKPFDIGGFAEYIYTKVSWVNNIVPDTMDLNRLFSSMNTAGIQLEPVDLLKAKLFRVITTEKNLYSKIWQACEHTDNYFERNLRQLFPNADWNALQYNNLEQFSDFFSVQQEMSGSQSQATKTLAMLLAEVKAGDQPASVQESKVVDAEDGIEDETVYCRSIIAFELLLIHSLRIYSANQGEGEGKDLAPRIKASNLLACFDNLLKQSEPAIKKFILLLWQVRFQFDKWVVKWVEHDDADDPQLRLTTISRSTSKGKSYINRAALELNELAQLQAVRNFTGDRSAHYWLTAFLARLVANPDQDLAQVLAALEKIDNQLSLTSETQKEASFKIALGNEPELKDWQTQVTYLDAPKGTGFEHYWFQKLEYLLWKHGDKSDEYLKRYRITSKNSVEHVHPQNEEHNNKLPKDSLDAFGNLVLLSPGENSSYSNQTVLKKKADFDSKPRYDSLKLKELFATYKQANSIWTVEEIKLHQLAMIEVLKQHYAGYSNNLPMLDEIHQQ